MKKPVLVVRHVPHEAPGLLAEVLDEEGAAYLMCDQFAEDPVRFDPAQHGGLVVMGGPMNVDQTVEFPFLAEEVRWIRQAIEADLPVLGICLGAQLLAKALGSRVYPGPEKEIGWLPLTLTRAAHDDPLLAECPADPVVFQWHGDTFDLPAGAVHLASTRVCPHQAFRFGRAAYGLQFHVEMTPGLLDQWLTNDGMCAELSGLPGLDADTLRRQSQEELPRLQRVGRPILERFVDLI